MDAHATNPSGGKNAPDDGDDGMLVLGGCMSVMEGLVLLICRNILHVVCVFVHLFVCACECVHLFDLCETCILCCCRFVEVLHIVCVYVITCILVCMFVCTYVRIYTCICLYAMLSPTRHLSTQMI